AEGADGCDADHDDQRQHDRVLDSRRAVFTLQEIDELLLQIREHENHPFVQSRKRTCCGEQKPLINRAISPLQTGEQTWLPANSWVDWPFGNLAIPEGPMALRPTFADGLPLSRNPAAPSP